MFTRSGPFEGSKNEGIFPLMGARSAAVVCTAVLALAPLCSLADDSHAIRIDANFTADSNVTRAKNAQDRLSDRSFGLTLGKGFEFPIAGSEPVRLLVSGLLGSEKFQTYAGLSRNFAGAEAELQYRPSAEFGAPTFGVFLHGYRDAYESALRDGYRYSAGVSVRKSVTDRIDLFATLAGNTRDSRSTVFDTQDRSARLNLDYALTRTGTLYLSGEYRRGDVVTTTPASVATESIARASVRDDVFTGAQRTAYRVDARSVLGTLGYNLAFDEGRALDISWRFVRSTPTTSPALAAGATIRYDVNQLSVSCLILF